MNDHEELVQKLMSKKCPTFLKKLHFIYTNPADRLHSSNILKESKVWLGNVLVQLAIKNMTISERRVNEILAISHMAKEIHFTDCIFIMFGIYQNDDSSDVSDDPLQGKVVKFQTKLLNLQNCGSPNRSNWPRYDAPLVSVLKFVEESGMSNSLEKINLYQEQGSPANDEEAYAYASRASLREGLIVRENIALEDIAN